MYQAATGGDPELIRALADQGQSLNHPSDYGSPLYAAAARGHVAAVTALIELGANIREPGPLHAAVSSNRPQIIRLLLAAGADPSQVDRQGRTPLDIAKIQRNAAIISILEEFASEGKLD
jgi:ankyrin repeat protein